MNRLRKRVDAGGAPEELFLGSTRHCDWKLHARHTRPLFSARHTREKSNGKSLVSVLLREKSSGYTPVRRTDEDEHAIAGIVSLL